MRKIIENILFISKQIMNSNVKDGLYHNTA